jgi:hypothetical protein
MHPTCAVLSVSPFSHYFRAAESHPSIILNARISKCLLPKQKSKVLQSTVVRAVLNARTRPVEYFAARASMYPISCNTGLPLRVFVYGRPKRLSSKLFRGELPPNCIAQRRTHVYLRWFVLRMRVGTHRHVCSDETELTG